MCNHRLHYHSEHKMKMIVYCEACGAQWLAVMFIGPHGPDEPPPFLDQPEPPKKSNT